jgi:hypothetical protein
MHCYFSSTSGRSVKAADEYRYIKHVMRLTTRFNELLNGLDCMCFVALEVLSCLLHLQLRIVLVTIAEARSVEAIHDLSRLKLLLHRPGSCPQQCQSQKPRPFPPTSSSYKCMSLLSGHPCYPWLWPILLDSAQCHK